VSRYTLNSVRTHFDLPDDKLFLETNPVDRNFWKPYNKEQEQVVRTDKLNKLFPLDKGGLGGILIGLYYGRTGVEK